MGRKLVHALLVILLGTVPMLLGIVMALTVTGPGRALLAREVSWFLDDVLRGDVEVGAISGSFLFGLKLDDLVIRDTAGVLFARVPHAEVGYSIPNLLAGRIILSDILLVEPTIQVIKHRSGRLNYEEILKLGEGEGGGPSPLVELRGVRIDSGQVRVMLPWDYPRTATTAQAREAALAAQRDKPGRIIEDGPEGLRKVITLDPLTGRFPLIRIATPDRRPMELQVDTLAVRLNDPGITLSNFAGRVRIKGDSATLSIAQGAFQRSRFQGGGVLTWPRGQLGYDLSLEVTRLDLRDLRWISPDFPDMQGRATLGAFTESPATTAFVLNDLHLEQGDSRIDGDLTAVLDTARGLGVRDMDVRLHQVNLDIARPYLDTLPLDGTLTGRLAATGYFDALKVDLDLTFDDARIAEQARSSMTADGTLHLGGPDGAVFDRFRISVSDFDLRSVRLVSPAVRLNGRAQLAGTLEGPWKNVVFDGRVEHQDLERGMSAIEGRVRLDTRGPVLGLESDLALDPINFDGLRGSFPTLGARGQLTGRIQTSGDLSRLALTANVQGDLGTVDANGTVILQPPHLGADSLDVRFRDLDLSAVTGKGVTTRLRGQALIDLEMDTLVAPHGTMRVSLDSSRIREFRLDTLAAQLAVVDSVIQLDTLLVEWNRNSDEDAGRISGSGTLGWAWPHSGEMQVHFSAASLAPFDSLLVEMSGTRRDSAPENVRLAGSGQAELTLTGALDTVHVAGEASVQDFQWQSLGTPGARATVEWIGGRRARAGLTLRSDSLRFGTQSFNNVEVSAAGWSDSLAWAGRVDLSDKATVSSGGRWWKRSGGWVLSLDTLTAALPVHTWRLARPADIAIADDMIRFTTLDLETDDTEGSIRVDGELPRTQPGTLTVAARGIALKDVYALMQRDTSVIAGSLGFDLEFGGTSAAPRFSGSGTAGDLVLGDFRAPFVQGVFNYEDQRLDANLLLWRTGANVLRVEARLPLDLALTGVERRQLPGELYIHAEADSVNLALLEAFTPNIRRVTGLLKTNVEITGTWDAPQANGFLEVQDGAVTVPSLGVRYGYMNGRLDFDGDSIVVERFRTTSGDGDIKVSGSIRLQRLTNPVLDVSLDADRFLAINSPTFLTLEASGQGTLTGPVYDATLRGDIVANSGVLHFADLLTKRIVNLSDPMVQDLIDTTLIRTQGLGAGFQSVFLDSLNIEDLRLTVRDQFWLRSSDANIQLEGSVLVNKVGRQYRFDGTFTALRGTYTLHIGFVTRDFQVDRGTVRYFGTPDLNAELDIQATHLVQTSTEEIPVIAKISGTLLLPRLSLESTIRPEPTESELVSYLMFGRPSPDIPGIGGADAQQQQALETGLAYLGSALSSEIQRTLVSDIGIPIDFFEIRTGTGSLFTGGGRNQITAGWQLGNRTFFTINAGFCQDFTNLGARSFGSSLEYRLSRVWRVQSSIEPVLNCRPAGSTYNLPVGQQYQFGTDLLWEKEY